MPAFATSKIGKFAFAIFSVTGSSLLLANILSSSLSNTTPTFTTNVLTDSELLKLFERDLNVEEEDEYDEQEEETSTPQHKKCKVVLTSKDQNEKPNYSVLACDEPQNRRTRNWYLFDSHKGSLEQIDGLTTENNTGKGAFESTDSWWKNKQWQGYKGRASRRYWGKNLVGSPFELKYVSNENSVKFPFFNYLRLFCQGWELRKYRGLRFLDSSCSHFDIPVHDFGIHLIKPDLKQAFGDEKDVCLIKHPKINSEKKWELKEESCESHPVSK